VTVSSPVAVALDELESAFAGSTVDAAPDGNGGAWVRLTEISLGPAWKPTSTWLGFHIANTYPYAGVYPHFIDGGAELARGGLPPAVSAGHAFAVGGRPCLQISRQSPRWHPGRDTAATKALSVITWLRCQ
jgi:hypothetical protein